MLPTSKTKLNAVIGYPLEHTLSPLLHTRAYELLGIDAVMLAFPHKDCVALIQSIRTLPIHLAAVTIPHKETIIKYVDVIDPRAQEIGSVNTLINREGRLYGYNTDAIGMQNALTGVVMRDKHVLIIGAGGAAKAVAWVMKKNGARLSYLNRTQEKSLMLQTVFGGTAINKDEARGGVFDIIINTTPLGMHPHIDETPLENFQFLPHHVVFDLIYNPRETRLLREAKTAGAKTIGGVEMFLEQAFAQISLWTGKEIPEGIKQKLRITL